MTYIQILRARIYSFTFLVLCLPLTEAFANDQISETEKCQGKWEGNRQTGSRDLKIKQKKIILLKRNLYIKAEII